MSTAPIHPERFDPAESGGRLVHAEHIARYHWAAQAVAGKEVLDAGCGTGYGTAILAQAGPARLCGVDVASDAIEATRAHLGDAAALQIADVRELPFEDDSFDAVVCFEVIEHIEDPLRAITEFARVLRPTGVLLISSPNRNTYPAGNEHHVHEFTPEELREALGTAFASVRTYRQHAWLASAIAPDGVLRDDGSGEADAVPVRTLHAEDAREELFMVALAGQAALPDMGPLAVLGDPFEVKWWEDKMDETRARAESLVAEARSGVANSLDELRRKLEIERAKADEAGRRMTALEGRLIDTEQENARLIDARVEAEGGLQGTREEIERLRYRVERADQVMRDMQGSLSWRLTKPLRKLKPSKRG